MRQVYRRKIKKNRKLVISIRAPRRRHQYGRRSPRPPIELLSKGVYILHIHQVTSSIAPNSCNRQFQRARQTRKNHTRVNNSMHLGNSGQGWRRMLYNLQQLMSISLIEPMPITLPSSHPMSCSPINQDHQDYQCAIEIPLRCQSQRRGRVELEEGSIWSWNKTRTTPSWRQMTCSIPPKLIHWTDR